jgi:SAM-dependent methyltransferase
MPGLNFDRAVAFYDATRALPPGVDGAVRDALVQRLGLQRGARLLEVGVGTGRIALPFLERGYAYVGVDLAAGMMAELRRKLSERAPHTTAPLIQADAMALPLRPATFDVTIMINLLHLVEDYHAALAEVRRVLRQGGHIVVSSNEYAERVRQEQAAGGLTGPRRVTQQWNDILEQLGIDRRQPGARTRWLPNDELVPALEAAGFAVERAELARYQSKPLTPRERLAAHRERIFSSDWNIPEPIHAEAVRRLERWLDEQHGAPDTPGSDEESFVVLIGSLP